MDRRTVLRSLGAERIVAGSDRSAQQAYVQRVRMNYPALASREQLHDAMDRRFITACAMLSEAGTGAFKSGPVIIHGWRALSVVCRPMPSMTGCVAICE